MASVNSLNRLYQVFFLIHLPIIFGAKSSVGDFVLC